jgi:anti-anti-sigma regulatory factor
MVATKVARAGRPAAKATVRRTAHPVVEVSTLADGVVIRLAGAFRKAEADLLRGAFLRPRPAACREVIVDASGVTAVDESAVAVLLAAMEWTDETGGHLSFTRLSSCLEAMASDLGLTRMVPLRSTHGSLDRPIVPRPAAPNARRRSAQPRR